MPYQQRVPSSLERSMELLSMETELNDLLNNSQLSYKQKASFEEMLTATFDLLQAPLQGGRASLIDSSSIALYSKMQQLVSALAALIMNEEDVTRMDVRDVSGDDSMEFSEEEEAKLPPQSQDHRRRSIFTQSNASSSVSTPRLAPVRNLQLDGVKHQSSRESLRSPSFSSPKLPPFEKQPLQRRLQVIQTPVPRSFSNSSNHYEQRRTSRPASVYASSPSIHRTTYQHNDQYNVDAYDHRSRRNSAQFSSAGSQMDTPGKKRYSMRF